MKPHGVLPARRQGGNVSSRAALPYAFHVDLVPERKVGDRPVGLDSDPTVLVLEERAGAGELLGGRYSVAHFATVEVSMEHGQVTAMLVSQRLSP